MATATQILANANYRAKAYDVISTSVKKGKRDEYNAAAKELKLSLAQLIQNGVEEYIQRHGVEGYALVQAGEGVMPAVAKPESEKLSAEERRLLDAAAKFPNDTRKLFLKLVEDLAAKLEGKGGDGNGNE